MRLWSIIGLSVSLWSISAQSQTPNVVAWGRNDAGQIDVPADATNIVDISAGASFVLALRSDRTLRAWGDNYYGECSIPPGATNIIAIAAGGAQATALRADGTVFVWGIDFPPIYAVPATATNIVALAGGNAHDLALRTDKTIVGWGSDGYGQTDPPSTVVNPVAIAASGYHSLALNGDGTVSAWGYNGHGQISVPTDLANVVAIAAGWSHSVAVKQDGSVVVWGNGGTVPDSATNVVKVTAAMGQGNDLGDDFTLALRSDGSVLAWGDNSYHELDVPAEISTSGSVVKITAGYGFGVACKRYTPPNTNPPKNVMVVPSTQTVPTEGTIDIRVNAVGTSLTYQWNFEGMPIPGATGNTLSITNAQPIQSGTYSCLVSQPGGYAMSPPAQVIVAPVLTEYKASVLSILAEIGWTYDIQYQNKSGPTITWTNLAEVVITNQPQYYVDYTTINQPLRQYRLVRVLP